MKTQFPFRPLFLAFCISLFFINGLHGQLYRRELFPVTGEDWDHITHRTALDGGTITLFSTYNSTTVDHYLNLVKTSASGTIEWVDRWQPSFSTPIYLNPAFNQVGLTADSGFMVCYTNPVTSWYFVRRVDGSGNTVYSRKVSIPSPYVTAPGAPEIIVKENGNSYIVGLLRDQSAFPYRYVLHVFELDIAGTVLWSHIYNWEYDSMAKLLNLCADTCSNGDLVIMSYHYDTLNSQDCPQITRLTPTGAVVWSKYYSVPGSSNIPISLVVVPGDEIVVANEANSSTDLFNLMRCDGQGNVLWSYEFSSSLSYHITTSYGKLMEAENNTTVLWATASGTTGVTSLMVKNDSTGTALCQRQYPLIYIQSAGDILPGQRYSVVAARQPSATFVQFTTDLCGQAACNDAGFTVTRTPVTPTVVSMISDSLLPVTASPVAIPLVAGSLTLVQVCSGEVGYNDPSPEQVAVYPVPAGNQIRIESPESIEQAELIDVQGRVVFTQQLQGAHAAVLELPKLADGIYLLRLSGSDNMIVQRKILIQQN